MKTLKFIVLPLAVITGLFFAQVGCARNTLHNYDIQKAVKRGMEEAILLENVRLYFAGGNRLSIPGGVEQLQPRGRRHGVS